MLLKLTPDHPTIRFMRHRFVAIAMSIVMILGSIALVAVRGFNFGIDFEGGILIEIGAPEPVDLAPLRSGLSALNIGEVAIQAFGGPEDVLIRVARQEGDIAAQEAAVEKVKARAQEIIPGEVSFRRVEFVGPKVSSELVAGGILAVAIAIVASMMYIWFRFEWQFGVGAAASLVHDVAVTMGLFSLVRIEFNLSVIAALLTIIGYSLNDTVVIFDRIRENLRKYRKMDVVELIDLSLNETWSRTILTSVTTFLALGALLLFGGAVIRGFTAAMLWGLFIGTYSTVFIAAPILPWLNLRARPEESEEKAAERP